MIEYELKKAKVPYKKQVKIGHYRVDFFLEDGTIVECDGKYFHTVRRNTERETKRDDYLLGLGYKMAHLTERAILESASECVEMIV